MDITKPLRNTEVSRDENVFYFRITGGRGGWINSGRANSVAVVRRRVNSQQADQVVNIANLARSHHSPRPVPNPAVWLRMDLSQMDRYRCVN